MPAVAIWATARALPNTPQNDPEIVEVILNSMLNVVSSDDFSHLLRARRSPNKNARRVGYVLFVTSLILLISGVLLLRIAGGEGICGKRRIAREGRVGGMTGGRPSGVSNIYKGAA